MGEHLEISGKKMKIGTCQDLMYIRREELESLPNTGVYLKQGHFYRFPWPWEGELSFYYQQRDPGFQMDDKHKVGNMAISYEHLESDMEEFPHKEMSVRIDGRTTAEGFNHKIPCPASEDWNGREVKYGTIAGPHPKVHIYRRMYKHEQFYTVFKCGYCGQAFAMETKDIEAYREFLMTKYQNSVEEGESDDGWEAYKLVAERLEARTE